MSRCNLELGLTHEALFRHTIQDFHLFKLVSIDVVDHIELEGSLLQELSLGNSQGEGRLVVVTLEGAGDLEIGVVLAASLLHIERVRLDLTGVLGVGRCAG